MLRKQFGWAGEGKFWALNNMIAESENCMMNIEDLRQVEVIATDLDLTAEEFLKFIQFLVDKIRLVMVENGFITTQMVQEVLNGVSKKRGYQRNWYKSNSNIERGNQSIETTVSNIESELSNIENEQSKVKEKKVKESKVITPPKEFNLENSNLYRKPVIPSKEDVFLVFKSNGGTEEMAEKFFANNSATDWYFRNNPITNFANLVPGFITNWKKYQQDEPAPSHGIKVVI